MASIPKTVQFEMKIDNDVVYYEADVVITSVGSSAFSHEFGVEKGQLYVEDFDIDEVRDDVGNVVTPITDDMVEVISTAIDSQVEEYELQDAVEPDPDYGRDEE